MHLAVAKAASRSATEQPVSRAALSANRILRAPGTSRASAGARSFRSNRGTDCDGNDASVIECSLMVASTSCGRRRNKMMREEAIVSARFFLRARASFVLIDRGE